MFYWSKKFHAYTDQYLVAFLHDIVSHSALSVLHTHKLTLYWWYTQWKENKFNNLAGANIQKMKGTKHEELEEALTIWVEQLHVKNGTATDEIIKERGKMMCKLCALVPS